jgi:hypothetical protein
MAGARAFTLWTDRVVGAEARAATTGAGGLWVGDDAEAAAHHGFDKIDDGSGHERQAHFVDDQFDTVGLEDTVTLECAVINGHAVRVAAASAGFDEDAHGGVEFVVLGQDFQGFLSTEFGDLHHLGPPFEGLSVCAQVGLFSRIAPFRWDKGVLEYVRPTRFGSEPSRV